MFEAQKQLVIYAAAVYLRRFYMNPDINFKTHHESTAALAALYLALTALNLDDLFLLPPGDVTSTQAHLIACRAVALDFPGLLGIDEISSQILHVSAQIGLSLSYDLMPTENAIHIAPALFDVMRAIVLRRSAASAASAAQEERTYRLIDSYSKDTLSLTETDPYFALNRKQTVSAVPTLISQEASEAYELDCNGWVELLTGHSLCTGPLW